MKRIIIIFLIIIFAKIICFSQNTSKTILSDSTVLITFDQLKKTNLIFIEHDKLIKENELLTIQINNYQSKIDLLCINDSLKSKQIYEFKELDNSRISQIKSLEKDINSKKNVIKYLQFGGIILSISLIVVLLL